jgi:hypothetical protein
MRSTHSHNRLDSGQPSIADILLRWFLGGQAVLVGQHTRAKKPIGTTRADY